MAYLVSLAVRAQRDLISLYEDINAKESAAALRWYQGLKLAILSLEEHPNRCPITPESKQNPASALRPQAPCLSRDLPRLREEKTGRYPPHSLRRAAKSQNAECFVGRPVISVHQISTVPSSPAEAHRK